MTHQTDVCIAGGGPAGMILGLLLAKVGIRVLVLEQHKDFAREYRGEVLMPRFTQMMKQLGLYEHISKSHHVNLEKLELNYQNKPIGEISFKNIVPEVPYALWMPQPELLDSLYQKAKTFPTFDMWFSSSAKTLLQKNGKPAGVVVQKEHDMIEVEAKITVGTDGRFSTIRRAGQFEVEYRDYNFDIIWFTIPKPEGYTNTFKLFLTNNRNLLALPKYPNHIQCGLVAEKGEYARLLKEGVDSIRQILLKTTPLVHEFANSLKDFSVFNVLQAELDMIKDWEKDGVLLVGDAAHTCSPVGAIGVSVAVETAITAAGVIRKCFQTNNFSKEALNEVQNKRYEDVAKIHKIQKRFSGILLSKNPLIKFLLPHVLPLIARTSLLTKTLRNLAALPKPLDVDPEFIFKN